MAKKSTGMKQQVAFLFVLTICCNACSRLVNAKRTSVANGVTIANVNNTLSILPTLFLPLSNNCFSIL